MPRTAARNFEFDKRWPPSISVIIPHLNQPDALQYCLRSLHEQAFDLPRVEIVVVDNGSTSTPVGICAGFPDVRLEEESTPGPGPARNRGVSVSRGEILAFIDADCVADRNWLAAIATAFSREVIQIAGGDVRISFLDPERPTMLEAYESIFTFRQKEYIERQDFSATCNLAVRRSAYIAVGPFAGIEIAEDRDWGRRASSLGYSTRYLPSMIVFHPARRTVADLCAKWDRHISHDFTERPDGILGRLRWALRAIAVGCSPVFAIRRILISNRVSSWRGRGLAAIALLRIRLYRARKMLTILLGRPRSGLSRSWNR